MSNRPHPHSHSHSHSHGSTNEYGVTKPVFTREAPLPWGEGPHPVTGLHPAAPRPDLNNFYDSDHAELMATLDRVQASYAGRDDVDLESVRREIIDRCANIGWQVSVIGQIQRRPDGTWDARTDGLGYQVIVEGRITPEVDFDHERKAFEVVHDVGGIEPDKKDVVVDANGVFRSAPTTFSLSSPSQPAEDPCAASSPVLAADGDTEP